MHKTPAEIAVVGMSCWYPGARTPLELWENILGKRQQFRRFREERMPSADYHSDDPGAPDRTYGRLGAFIDGFVFDCAARRVPQSTFSATDIVHWLALDVAAAALRDAGCPEAEGLPRERTGVLLGNSLTGEFSRATSLRLRWPFVERVLRAAAQQQGLSEVQIRALIVGTRERYLAPFPATSEDTLAGALSNTIAGRICGVFDLGGGGYVVDGACASGLLAVTTAASALEEGRIDACLAGGVDISMDPFELVGFAKARALTPTDMRVYDRRGNGFIPGEGCGFVVLKRLSDARAAGDKVYAVIRGWGVSSDGRNAITAPKVAGQVRAIRAAWERGGRPDFVEGHGTGTSLGDRVELEAIATAGESLEALGDRAVGVTSLKSILGHTKAAAGIGALLKAVMAANRRVLPPTAGCVEPNAVFDGPARGLYPLLRGEVRPPASSLMAGVSAMGFGGINAHVVLVSGDAPDPRIQPAVSERRLLASYQPTELFVLGADTVEALRDQARSLRALAVDISRAELADLSAELLSRLPARPATRAAFVADSPETLVARLDQLITAGPCDGPELWLGHPTSAPRLAFLCPGQGSQDIDMARTLIQRDEQLAALAERLARVAEEEGCPELLETLWPSSALDDGERARHRAALSRTELAQPALCLVTLLWATRLAQLGLEPASVAGHSLGELSAFALAGAMTAQDLMRLAVRRGKAMAAPAERPAGMLSLATDAGTAQRLCDAVSGYVAVANINGPAQVVVAGERGALDQVAELAKANTISARRLPVSNAFHSELVAGASLALRDAAIPETPLGLRCHLWSSLVEAPIDTECALREHMAAHVRAPVDFVSLLRRAAAGCDLLVEVGAGRVLSGLAESIVPTRCLPVEGRAERSADLQAVLAAAWVRGAEIRWEALHQGRLIRPFVAPAERVFLVNPCELGRDERATPLVGVEEPAASPAAQPASASVLDSLLDLVAERTGFARTSLSGDQRLREELNLDSIKSGEIVATVARRRGVADRVDPAQLASHPLERIAEALIAAGAKEEASPAPQKSPGVSPAQPASPTPARWVRSFGLSAVPAPAAPPSDWTGLTVKTLGLPELEGALRRAGATLAEEAEVLIAAMPHTLPEQVRALHEVAASAARAVVLVQRLDGAFGLRDPGAGAAVAAFARSLWLERPQLAVRVVDIGDADPVAVLGELPDAPGFSAFGLRDGQRCQLSVAPLVPHQASPRPNPIQAGELVLATGGAKGITAACALALAKSTGARLALVGSTAPEQVDDEVLRNLGQATLAGVEARYFACDLSDAAAVSGLVARVRQTMGPIAAVVHGAGRNTPRRLEQLSAEDALTEMAPKLQGVHHLAAALHDQPPRYFVALSSIIGVTGMQGNAWYAFANENLDLAVARFAAAHPSCTPISAAFGVWGEIGMGAKLGSVGHLERMGIGALDPAEGCARFVRLLTHDPGVRQPIIAAHLDGLATWPTRTREDDGLNLLDGPRSGVPDVACTARVRLHPDTHPWLRDHSFQGSLLLPTVLGLEFMAQAAYFARGGEIRAIEDIDLPAPVVVADEGITVEIRALVDEEDPTRVRVELFTEQTGYARPHFVATFCLGEAPQPETRTLPPLRSPATPLLPTRDLYGGLLFQGPAFHRMGQVLGADEQALRFEGEVRAPEQGRWLLGDPFFRDALLQAGQLLIPHDDALPVHIDRVELFHAGEPGPRQVLAALVERGEKSHLGEVTVVDAEGRLRERMSGYRLQVLARHPDRPDLSEILDPGRAEGRLSALVEADCVALGVPAPTLALGWEPINQLPKASRHAAELPLIRRLEPLAGLSWQPSGRPTLADGRGLSVSHDDHVCLVMLGVHGLACDLEPIAHRDDWPALLGPRREAYAALTGDRATAGTRVWTASEALYKAGASAPQLTLESQDGPLALFRASEADRRWLVLTRVVDLPRGPRRVLALALPESATRSNDIDPESHQVRMHRGTPDRMETNFVVAFDESSSVRGQVPAYSLATWMGRLRELALAGLRKPLRAALASGRFGMVTQAAELQLDGEAEALDRIEAHTRVEELKPTTCLLRFTFRRLTPGGLWEPVGEASQRFGWVEVLGHGQVRAAPFPPFLHSFLASLHLESPRPAPTPIPLPQSTPMCRGVFATTLVESNVVGNLYYAHYFRWPQRLLDQWLWEHHRGLVMAHGAQGELQVTQMRLEFLREAMPFDSIEVSLHVEEQNGPNLSLLALYQRVEPDGSITRLAVGQIRASWRHLVVDGVSVALQPELSA